MNNEVIRIGIIGAGSIARELNLPNLQALSGVHVVAVCNSRERSAQKIADEFGIGDVEVHWQAMVARDDLDAIWIGTPPMMHAAITIAALESGKHVFCQARMAMDLAEARAMLAASRQHPELVTMLSPPPMGMRSGRVLEKLIVDRYVGQIRHFSIVANSDMFVDASAPVHWRQRRELSGLNALTVGIYFELLQRWIGRPTHVQAQSHVFIPQRDDYVVEVPDVVQIATQFGDNVTGSLELSSVARFAPHPTLTIYGSEGTLEYDFATDTIRGAQQGDLGLHQLTLSAELETRWSVEADFIGAVRSGGHPEPSFETGVAYMEATEAVHLSSVTGQRISLPLS